jgi:glutamyl-tRNA reductase
LSNHTEQPILFAVGINHKTAAIEAREKIYVDEREIPALIAKLSASLSESLVLSTCNRTEIYGVTTRTDLDTDYYKDLLIDFKNAGDVVKREHFFASVSCAACQQLFSVATSVDSKIVGDTQILGQLRDAYAVAKRHQSTGKILNQLLQRAFKTGKQARAETNLHKGAVSISLAAVELAVETFGSLADKTLLILGAGETAQMTAECLIQRRVGKILISNRTNQRAEELIAGLKNSEKSIIETIEFDDFKNHLDETDIIISSTSAPEPILSKTDFEFQTNKILLIDIAMPRDIAPDAAENEFVVLKNIDDLHQIVDRNFERRMSDVPRVKRIIAAEMADFLVWYYSLPLLPAMMHRKSKPDAATQTEIVKIKKFLLANVSELHKMAMRGDADDFAGHVAVVKQLTAMKNAAFSEAGK